MNKKSIINDSYTALSEMETQRLEKIRNQLVEDKDIDKFFKAQDRVTERHQKELLAILECWELLTSIWVE